MSEGASHRCGPERVTEIETCTGVSAKTSTIVRPQVSGQIKSATNHLPAIVGTVT